MAAHTMMGVTMLIVGLSRIDLIAVILHPVVAVVQIIISVVHLQLDLHLDLLLLGLRLDLRLVAERALALAMKVNGLRSIAMSTRSIALNPTGGLRRKVEGAPEDAQHVVNPLLAGVAMEAPGEVHQGQLLVADAGSDHEAIALPFQVAIGLL